MTLSTLKYQNLSCPTQSSSLVPTHPIPTGLCEWNSISEIIDHMVAENETKQANFGYIIGENLYYTFQWLSEKTNPNGLSLRYLSWRLLPTSILGDTGLHHAIENADMTAVHYFIPLVDINSQRFATRNAPIHLAIMNKFREAIRLLIQNGANVNLLNKDGFSPLGLALLADNKEIFKLLLAAGADINLPCPGFSNFTPLQIVIGQLFSFRDIITESILEHTTTLTANLLYDVRDYTSAPKMTPLMFAAIHRDRRKMIADLLSKGADINLRIQSVQDEVTVASNLIEGNHNEGLQAILLHNPDIESPYKKKGIQTTLLREGLNNPSTHNVMARHYLSKVTPSTVNQSIQLGEDKSITPIMLAIELNDPKILETLIAQGADIEALHSEAHMITTPLQKALASQKLRPIMAKAILNQTSSTSVNRLIFFEKNQSTTPLMLALELGDESIIQALLTQGADPNIPMFTSDGSTMTAYQWTKQHEAQLSRLPQLQQVALAVSPLQQAIQEKNVSAVKRHARNTNLINHFDSHGNSPLQLAIQEGFFEAIPIIVNAMKHHENYDLTMMLSVSLTLSSNQCHLLPALIGSIDNEISLGENLYQTKATPLMLAIQAGHIPAIQSLLSQGANLRHKGLVHGKITTPLEMMLYSHNVAINDIIFTELEKHSSSPNRVLGPKQKNAYTTLFENLIRRILQSNNSVKAIKRQDSKGRVFFNLVIHGEEYLMDNIIRHMDWEQLRLHDADYKLLIPVYRENHKFRELLPLNNPSLKSILACDKYADLNEIDANVIKHYTTGFSYKINGFLKGVNESEETDETKGPDESDAIDWWLYTAFFTNALNKIAPETTIRKFCRGQLLTETPLREQELTFISTSPDSVTCEQYSKGQAILWLANSYGKEITNLSDHTNIREFIIPPSTLRTERLIDEVLLKGEPTPIPETPAVDEHLIKRKR